MRRTFTAAVCLVAALSLFAGCGKQTPDTSAYAQGMQAISSEDYNTAVSDFQTAIDSDGRRAEGLRGQGIAYLYLGQYEQAVECFKGALDAIEYPDRNAAFREDVLYYEAQACAEMKDYDSALTIYDRLIKGDNPGQAYLLRGKLYAATDRFGQAGQDFQHAIELDGSYEIYLQVYDVYVQSNRQADGATFLKDAESREPQSADDYYQLGRISYELKDYDKAEKYLTQAADQDVQAAVILLGKVYLDANDLSGARSMYQKVIDAGKNVSIGWNGLALCEMADGSLDKALSDVQQGLSSGDTTMKEELLFNQIVIYERQYDFSTAASKMNDFLAAYPTNEAAVRENQFIQSRVTESATESVLSSSGTDAGVGETGQESVTSSSADGTDQPAGTDTSGGTDSDGSGSEGTDSDGSGPGDSTYAGDGTYSGGTYDDGSTYGSDGANTDGSAYDSDGTTDGGTYFSGDASYAYGAAYDPSAW